MRDIIHRLDKLVPIIFLILCLTCITDAAYSNDGDTKFLDSLQDLLGKQSDLLTSFDYLLHKTPTAIDEKVEFLNSFEDLLRRQANLLKGFEDLLHLNWDRMEIEQQERFLANFENLIRKETILVSSFEALCEKNRDSFPPEIQTKFLASFEDLLRKMADLLKSFEELFKKKNGGISIEKSANKAVIQKGETVTYKYTVRNEYKSKKITDVLIVDDKLGNIANGISLMPKENRSFTKMSTLSQSICNKATVMGKVAAIDSSNGENKEISNDPGEKIFGAESNTVCVLVRGGGNPEPDQYGQFCENQKVVGTGIIEASTSIKDKSLALRYDNTYVGNGTIELNSEHTLSENSSKLMRQVGNKTVPLNLYDDTTLSYVGTVPLTGEKKLISKEFEGGIGAEVKEAFSANEIEKKQNAFFASTDPAYHITNYSKALELENISPVYLVGLDTAGRFNGSWGTDANWHQMFKKDLEAQQTLKGLFEVEKLIKYHENPTPKPRSEFCEELDC
jgi:hypothetical protein